MAPYSRIDKLQFHSVQRRVMPCVLGRRGSVKRAGRKAGGEERVSSGGRCQKLPRVLSF